MLPVKKPTILSETLDLYDHGLALIPVNYKSKQPTVAWKQYLHDRPSKAAMRRWFDTNADMNVACIVGPSSGVVVLDVDDPSKFKQQVPKTPTVKTSRGYHYYFQNPEGVKLKTLSFDYGEFLAERHLVNVPPSVHENGTPYEWVTRFGEVPLAPVPEWLLKASRAKFDLVNGMPIAIPYADNDNDETTVYGQVWYDEILPLADEDKGGRNNALNVVAAKAGSLIAGGQLNEEEAREAMIEATKANGSWDENQREVLATIDSGISAGIRNPRAPAPKDDVPPAKGKLRIRSFEDIQTEKIEWVWEGFLAKGALSILMGYPGVGKSTISLGIAATVSNGGRWPVTGAKADQGNVIILSIEDVAESTVKPRLEAAGANMHRVKEISIEGRPFSLASDVDALREAIETVGDVRLIVVDPVTAHLGKADNNSVSDVRGITTQLSQLAQEYKVAILLVAHPNKNEKGSAINLMSGSQAWMGAARTAFLASQDGDRSEHISIAPVKNNISKMPPTYFCRLASKTVSGGVESSHIVWEDYTTNEGADAALAERRNGGGKVDAAVTFIRARLANGVVASTEMFSDAAAQGISEKTLKRAKARLQIATTIRDGKWYWELASFEGAT